MRPQPPNGNGHAYDPAPLLDLRQAIIQTQQGEIETLKAKRDQLEAEIKRLTDRLDKAETNEAGLQQRLGELQQQFIDLHRAPSRIEPSYASIWSQIKNRVTNLFG